MGKVIDDKKLLNYFYDSRETFVVDFDENEVIVEVIKGTVYFRLKQSHAKAKAE